MIFNYVAFNQCISIFGVPKRNIPHCMVAMSKISKSSLFGQLKILSAYLCRKLKNYSPSITSIAYFPNFLFSPFGKVRSQGLYTISNEQKCNQSLGNTIEWMKKIRINAKHTERLTKKFQEKVVELNSCNDIRTNMLYEFACDGASEWCLVPE